jgi:5-methyltetrahydrofolate--homocysteine methyltransferase
VDISHITVIGERLNSSRKAVARAIAEKDAAFIHEEARRQIEAGAHYIDVNAGAFTEKERMHMKWLVEIILPR